VGLTK
jgi:hypothetical protein